MQKAVIDFFYNTDNYKLSTEGRECGDFGLWDEIIKSQFETSPGYEELTGLSLTDDQNARPLTEEVSTRQARALTECFLLQEIDELYEQYDAVRLPDDVRLPRALTE